MNGRLRGSIDLNLTRPKHWLQVAKASGDSWIAQYFYPVVVAAVALLLAMLCDMKHETIEEKLDPPKALGQAIVAGQSEALKRDNTRSADDLLRAHDMASARTAPKPVITVTSVEVKTSRSLPQTDKSRSRNAVNGETESAGVTTSTTTTNSTNAPEALPTGPGALPWPCPLDAAKLQRECDAIVKELKRRDTSAERIDQTKIALERAGLEDYYGKSFGAHLIERDSALRQAISLTGKGMLGVFSIALLILVMRILDALDVIDKELLKDAIFGKAKGEGGSPAGTGGGTGGMFGGGGAMAIAGGGGALPMVLQAAIIGGVAAAVITVTMNLSASQLPPIEMRIKPTVEPIPPLDMSIAVPGAAATSGASVVRLDPGKLKIDPTPLKVSLDELKWAGTDLKASLESIVTLGTAVSKSADVLNKASANLEQSIQMVQKGDSGVRDEVKLLAQAGRYQLVKSGFDSARIDNLNETIKYGVRSSPGEVPPPPLSGPEQCIKNAEAALKSLKPQDAKQAEDWNRSVQKAMEEIGMICHGALLTGGPIPGQAAKVSAPFPGQ